MTEGKLLKRAIIVVNIVHSCESPASHFPLTSCTIVPKYSVHIKVILCRLLFTVQLLAWAIFRFLLLLLPYCAVGSNCDTISWIQWRGSYCYERITRVFSVNAFFLLLDVVPQVIFRTLLKLLNIVVISDLNSSVTGRHQNEAYLPWDWGKSQW